MLEESGAEAIGASVGGRLYCAAWSRGTRVEKGDESDETDCGAECLLRMRQEARVGQ